MKLVKVIFIIAIAMVLVMACTGATMLYDDEEEDEAPSLGVDPVSTNLPNTPSALRGVSRFLAQEDKPKKLKCRKNPAVCLAQGSSGPNCCKNKCVDLRTDHRNCGVCGKKCKFTEECCRGGCVNLAFDKRHCGRCNNPCKKGRKGSFCVYGMCNYA